MKTTETEMTTTEITPLRRAWSVAVFARRTSGVDAGKVLLIAHKRLLTWLPVGGEIEEGEAPLQAARRELKEETGLDGVFVPLAGAHAVAGSPPGLLAYEEHAAGQKGMHQNFCFLVDVDDTAVVNNEEFDNFAFVDRTSLMALRCPENVRQLALCALAGGRHPHTAIARDWLQRFNNKDLDGLLELYSDDAVHISPKLRERQPETRGEIAGKAALRAWWQDAFVRLPGLTYVEKRVVAEGDSVFLEYARQVPGEADMVVAELYIIDPATQKILQSQVFHG